jgi:hypothetical protein
MIDCAIAATIEDALDHKSRLRADMRWGGWRDGPAIGENQAGSNYFAMRRYPAKCRLIA